MTVLAPLGADKWDFEDARRVLVQRNAITRVRPGMHAGWRATFDLLVAAPEYIPPMALHATLTRAGQLVGIGDFRPTFGRFAIVGWELNP